MYIVSQDQTKATFNHCKDARYSCDGMAIMAHHATIKFSYVDIEHILMSYCDEQAMTTSFFTSDREGANNGRIIPPLQGRKGLKEYAQAEGVSSGFGVDLVSASDLSHGIGVSETAEY